MTRKEIEQKKAKAHLDNFNAHKKEIQPFEDPIKSWVKSDKDYNNRDFSGFEKVVSIIYEQRGMRYITSSHNVFHALYMNR